MKLTIHFGVPFLLAKEGPSVLVGKYQIHFFFFGLIFPVGQDLKEVLEARSGHSDYQLSKQLGKTNGNFSVVRGI